MKDSYVKTEYCRIFPQEKLELIFDLGFQPLANSLRSSLDDKILEAPLALSWSEKSQSVQLTVNVDSKFLFQNYVWVTGTSQATREYAELFADRFLKQVNKSHPFIVEIASNDGTFLKPIFKKGAKVLGVDPAKNIASMANQEGIQTLPEFFNSSTAEFILANFGKCDGLIARNVIPHVEHLDEVLLGIVNLLSENGIGAFEFHYAGTIIEELHYDSIYHEHLHYFSLTGMNHVLEKFNLYAYDLEKSSISGGSYVLYFSKLKKPLTKSYSDAIKKELEKGVNKKESWVAFAEKSRQHAKELFEIVQNEKNEGRKVIGYGASARSSTMLNFSGINHEYLSCVADKSALKHNKFTAGTDIKILSPQEALMGQPDTILLLAWNFEKEIIEEIKNLGFKGKVIIPLPSPIREMIIS